MPARLRHLGWWLALCCLGGSLALLACVSRTAHQPIPVPDRALPPHLLQQPTWIPLADPLIATRELEWIATPSAQALWGYLGRPLDSGAARYSVPAYILRSSAKRPAVRSPALPVLRDPEFLHAADTLYALDRANPRRLAYLDPRTLVWRDDVRLLPGSARHPTVGVRGQLLDLADDGTLTVALRQGSPVRMQLQRISPRGRKTTLPSSLPPRLIPASRSGESLGVLYWDTTGTPARLHTGTLNLADGALESQPAAATLLRSPGVRDPLSVGAHWLTPDAPATRWVALPLLVQRDATFYFPDQLAPQNSRSSPIPADWRPYTEDEAIHLAALDAEHVLCAQVMPGGAHGEPVLRLGVTSAPYTTIAPLFHVRLPMDFRDAPVAPTPRCYVAGGLLYIGLTGAANRTSGGTLIGQRAWWTSLPLPLTWTYPAEGWLGKAARYAVPTGIAASP